MSCKLKDLREKVDSDGNASKSSVGSLADRYPRVTVVPALTQWTHSS